MTHAEIIGLARENLAHTGQVDVVAHAPTWEGTSPVAMMTVAIVRIGGDYLVLSFSHRTESLIDEYNFASLPSALDKMAEIMLAGSKGKNQ